ncbi:hypothetical protein ScPMuIL_007524 [Solemya velum]
MSSEFTENDESTSSNDYTKYGITDTPKATVTTAWGKTKTFAGLYPKEWAFVGISLVNILLAVGLTLYSFIHVIQENPQSPDFTFALLLLINASFCLFYVIHGVLREREYELYVLIIAILVVLVYCIVEYAFLNVNGRTTVKLVRMILACVMAPVNIYLAWAVAHDFGYLEFRIVGASEYLQHLYQQASIFSCLLKFDIQVTSSFVLLALKEGVDLDLMEKITLGVGVPYTIAWAILGWVVLKREIRIGALVFAVIGLAKPAYYIYKIVKLYIQVFDVNIHVTSTILYSLLTAGALAILVWIIVMLELKTVFNNFGKGLRERAFDLLATEKTSLLTGRRSRRRY